MATVIKAPNALPEDEDGRPIIFLAGSIENGKASDWQSHVASLFAEEDVILLNPRRDGWDPTWIRSIDNPQFKGQVDWELAGLEIADIGLMYLEPGTVSQISLLELGLYTNPTGDLSKMIVVCPDGYGAKANVEITCNRYKVHMASTLEEAVKYINEYIEKYRYW